MHRVYHRMYEARVNKYEIQGILIRTTKFAYHSPHEIYMVPERS